jgi:hypothetical protein
MEQCYSSASIFSCVDEYWKLTSLCGMHIIASLETSLKEHLTATSWACHLFGVPSLEPSRVQHYHLKSTHSWNLLTLLLLPDLLSKPLCQITQGNSHLQSSHSTPFVPCSPQDHFLSFGPRLPWSYSTSFLPRADVGLSHSINRRSTSVKSKLMLLWKLGWVLWKGIIQNCWITRKKKMEMMERIIKSQENLCFQSAS